MVEISNENVCAFVEFVAKVMDIRSDEYNIIIDRDNVLRDAPASVHLYPGMKKGKIIVCERLGNPSTESQCLEASIYLAEELAYIWQGLRHYEEYCGAVEDYRESTDEEREKHMWRIDAAAVALLLFGRFFDKHPPKNEWWHPSTYDLIVERANQIAVDLDIRIDLLSNNEL